VFLLFESSEFNVWGERIKARQRPVRRSSHKNVAVTGTQKNTAKPKNANTANKNNNNTNNFDFMSAIAFMNAIANLQKTNVANKNYNNANNFDFMSAIANLQNANPANKNNNNTNNFDFMSAIANLQNIVNPAAASAATLLSQLGFDNDKKDDDQ
jgi:hypothetical protein